ncbi:hypothetical protein [Lactococcus lactis]|uniref:hypothetical protein n=1 Tax=Lactococcus lactis TaxID=1358 RepID=UPI0004948C16|nr:hypothetical protein [Lactococcus lactis]
MIDLGKFFEKIIDNHLITALIAVILTGPEYFFFPRNPKSEINIILYLLFLFSIAFISITFLVWLFNKGKAIISNFSYNKMKNIELEQRYKDEDLKFISDNNIFDEEQKNFILNQILNDNRKKLFNNGLTPLDRFGYDDYKAVDRLRQFTVSTPKEGNQVYMKLDDKVFRYLNQILINYEKITDFDTVNDNAQVKKAVYFLKTKNN